jgi:hemerythrin-like domain-containing protein
VLDEAAEQAGRSPGAVRRLLNIGGRFSPTRRGFLDGPADQWVEELTELALTYGVSTFITPGDDPDHVRRFALEVAPAVRDGVDRERLRPGSRQGPDRAGETVRDHSPAAATSSRAGGRRDDVYAGLGVTPTRDDGVRRSARMPWDESTRPQAPLPARGATYSARGTAAAQHLVDIHDHLRSELEQVRDLVGRVRQGSLEAARARSAINEMTMRQNDWTIGAYCASYCRIVTGHHSLEDEAIFPHLRRERPLAPVIDRLVEEHVAIHGVLESVDRALARHLRHPEDFSDVEAALDLLSDTMLSHLAYEERELVEPLARLGFYPGQLSE